METTQDFKYYNYLNEDSYFDFINEYKKNLIERKTGRNQAANKNCFKSNILLLTKLVAKDYSNLDSFIAYVGMEGYTSVTFTGNNNILLLKKGESIIIPSSIKQVVLTPISTHSKLIEFYVD